MSQMANNSQASRLFPVLTTDRLLLREFSLEDVPAVFAMVSRKDISA